MNAIFSVHTVLLYTVATLTTSGWIDSHGAGGGRGQEGGGRLGVQSCWIHGGDHSPTRCINSCSHWAPCVKVRTHSRVQTSKPARKLSKNNCWKFQIRVPSRSCETLTPDYLDYETMASPTIVVPIVCQPYINCKSTKKIGWLAWS